MPFEDIGEFNGDTAALIAEYAGDGPRGHAGGGAGVPTFMDSMLAELKRQWSVHVQEMRSMKVKETTVTAHGAGEPSYRRFGRPEAYFTLDNERYTYWGSNWDKLWLVAPLITDALCAAASSLNSEHFNSGARYVATRLKMNMTDENLEFAVLGFAWSREFLPTFLERCRS